MSLPVIIHIKLNGEDRRLPPGMNVREVLEYLDLETTRVAVEVNRRIIRRKEWIEIEVRDRDTLEVVHFVGGG